MRVKRKKSGGCGNGKSGWRRCWKWIWGTKSGEGLWEEKFKSRGRGRLFGVRKFTSRGAAVWKGIGLGLGFLYFFSDVVKITSSLNVLRNPVFIGKMLLGFSTWSLNFLLFVNFDFSYFFVFFENEQYQRRLNEENQ